MGVIPNTRLGKVEFYEAHITPWTTNAVGIGLTAAAVTALAEAVADARAAYDAHLAAQQAARAATQNFYEKVRLMHSAPGRGSDMLETIKTFARTTDDPNVYILAQIPPPRDPGALPPPGTPFGFTVGLLQNGSLELKWKCSNPPGTYGTIYEVRRQIGGGAFAFVGATGSRTFVDDTLPSGASPATYQVTGVRSTSRGKPAQFTVTFGVGGAGLSIAGVSSDTGASVKIAA